MSLTTNNHETNIHLTLFTTCTAYTSSNRICPGIANKY